MSAIVVPWTTRKRKGAGGGEEVSLGLLQRNVSRLFNEFLASSIVPEVLSDPLSQFGEKVSAFQPAVNVSKTSQFLRITVETPGMDERDIELSLTKEALTIRGERRQNVDEEEESVDSYSESLYGAFERVVPLTGVAVDEDRVEATSSKGIVTITLPFKEVTPGGIRKVSIRPE